MPSYTQALKEIYDLQEFSIKMGLENIRQLMKDLGNPHEEYPIIHIAGTNGKGSTAYFLAQTLRAHGLKTGLFTSPHLFDYRERIRIDEQSISKNDIIDFWQRNKDLIHDLKATFFDTCTALAFEYFKKQNVDVAVIETGLGGRLDSTNIVNPEIVIITPISIDHRKQLGDTIESVAAEKAGIIKPGCRVICAEQIPEAERVLRERLTPDNEFIRSRDYAYAEIVNTSLDGLTFHLRDDRNQLIYDNLITRQTGDFQAGNISLAYIAAREYLKSREINFSESRWREILISLSWPARLQRVRTEPNVILDVSHNLDGVDRTLKFIKQHIRKDQLHILAGLVNDKDYEHIAAILGESAIRITVCEIPTSRKLDGNVLRDEIKKTQKNVQLVKDCEQAFESALRHLEKEETLLVIGSHYLIGSLQKLI